MEMKGRVERAPNHIKWKPSDSPLAPSPREVTASTSYVLYMVVDHQSEIVGARADRSFSSRDDISVCHFFNRSGSAGLELAFCFSS